MYCVFFIYLLFLWFFNDKLLLLLCHDAGNYKKIRQSSLKNIRHSQAIYQNSLDQNFGRFPKFPGRPLKFSVIPTEFSKHPRNFLKVAIHNSYWFTITCVLYTIHTTQVDRFQDLFLIYLDFSKWLHNSKILRQALLSHFFLTGKF